MNKKGWIKVMEAAIVILLISGILIFIIGQLKEREDVSSQIYYKEIGILRDIELNDTLREEIINVADESLPVKWEDFDSNGLTETRKKIESKTPNTLNCEAMVCFPNSECGLENPSEKDIYVKSVLILSTLENYNPRQLKLFCWLR